MWASQRATFGRVPAPQEPGVPRIRSTPHLLPHKTQAPRRAIARCSRLFFRNPSRPISRFTPQAVYPCCRAPSGLRLSSDNTSNRKAASRPEAYRE